MKLFDHIYKAVNPLKYAIKKGMHVGKGVTLASKSGTSFGSEPYLITLEDEVRISGAATFITHDGGTWAIRDLDDYKEVKDSSTQAIVSMHQTASASSQERIKAYADLMKDPNTSPEERARMMALLEEESEHAKKLDETMPKKVQEIEKDYGDTIVKVGLILGGTVLLFGAPAAAYGVYRIYQSYKAR